MMTFIELGSFLLLLQTPAAPTDPAATERRTGISVWSQLPLSTGGTISHRDEGTPVENVKASPGNADASVNVSLMFDLGPFDRPTHAMLSVGFNRTGFDVTQEGRPRTRGDSGEWLAVEGIVGAEWMNESRSRFGGGVSFGYHHITYGLAVDGIHDIDESMGMMSFGVQVYGEYSLGSGFGIGAELRGAYLTTGGGGGSTFSDTGENGHGSTFFFGPWLRWEAARWFSIRLGYAVWKGSADWDVTPFLLTSPTASSHVEVTTSGPVLGFEFRF